MFTSYTSIPLKPHEQDQPSCSAQTDDGHALPVLLVGFVEFGIVFVVFSELFNDQAVLFIHNVPPFLLWKDLTETVMFDSVIIQYRTLQYIVLFVLFSNQFFKETALDTIL